MFIHFSSFSTEWHPSDTSKHQYERHNSLFVIQVQSYGAPTPHCQSDKHDLLRFCHLLLRSDVSVQFERLMLRLGIVHEDYLFVPINNVQ